jgi:hypothetical protein
MLQSDVLPPLHVPIITPGLRVGRIIGARHSSWIHSGLPIPAGLHWTDMSRRRAMMLLLAFVAVDAHPCTTFSMTVDGQVVFGANYDWDVRIGMVMVNKRSVARESLTQRPARWTSQYASITFNQYGRDFPTGGMNEAGLVVSLMDLSDTEYPAVDDRSSAGVLDWIQYQLDLSADIDQADGRGSSPRKSSSSGTRR